MHPERPFIGKGVTGDDLNEAQTLATDLNVFADFQPVLPESYKEASTVFLANIDPDLQRSVLEQVDNLSLVALDTMNFWIEGKLDALKKTLSKWTCFSSMIRRPKCSATQTMW